MDGLKEEWTKKCGWMEGWMEGWMDDLTTVVLIDVEMALKLPMKVKH